MTAHGAAPAPQTSTRSRRTCWSCIALLREPEPGQRVRAVPGAGLHVPIWILGSSLFGAQLAAELGLPFAFASHFAPALLMAAIEIYRSQFQPVGAGALERPYVMLGVNVVAADTDDEARRLFTSHQQVFLALRRGRSGRCRRRSTRCFEPRWTPLERAASSTASCRSAIVGSPDTVARGLSRIRRAHRRRRADHRRADI